MKKSIFTIALALTSIFVSAQKGKFTVALGTTENVSAWAIGSSNVDSKSIPIHAEVGYHLTKKFQLSLAINHSSASSKEIDLLLFKFKQDAQITSVFLRANYFWISKDKFQMGSGLGMGYGNASSTITIIPSNAGTTDPADIWEGFGLHLNLLEARYFFTENIGIYGNFGFRNQGLYGVGIIGRF